MKKNIKEIKDELSFKIFSFINAPDTAPEQGADTADKAAAQNKTIPLATFAFALVPLIITIVDCIMSASAGKGFVTDGIYSALSGNNALIAQGEIWRVLTAPLVYGQILDAALLTLMFFGWGTLLERLLGHWRYTAIILISAVVGNLASALFRSPDFVFSGLLSGSLGLITAISAASKYNRKIILTSKAYILWAIISGRILAGAFVAQTDFISIFASLIASVTIGVSLTASRFNDKNNEKNGLILFGIEVALIVGLGLIF
jgi:membrane associated rhomboid family serine protease